jgi:hypothetical protein
LSPKQETAALFIAKNALSSLGSNDVYVTLNGVQYGPIGNGEYCFLYNFTSLCQNQGYCVIFNQAPSCQCATFATFQYTGDYCEHKTAATATTTGQMYTAGQLTVAIVVPIVLLLVLFVLVGLIVNCVKK